MSTTFTANGKTFTQVPRTEVTKSATTPWEECGSDIIISDEPMTDDDLAAIRKELYMFPVVKLGFGKLSDDHKAVQVFLTYDNCD